VPVTEISIDQASWQNTSIKAPIIFFVICIERGSLANSSVNTSIVMQVHDLSKMILHDEAPQNTIWQHQISIERFIADDDPKVIIRF
jgi:hypothetical protein